jgi:hypothetical protein
VEGATRLEIDAEVVALMGLIPPSIDRDVR